MIAHLTPICDHCMECRVFDDGHDWGDPFVACCNVVRMGTTGLVSMLLVLPGYSVLRVYRAIYRAMLAAGFVKATWNRRCGARPGVHEVSA